MSKGVKLKNIKTKPCVIQKINNYTFKIILTQGLNRQIRRMCEFLGYEVTKLKRTRIMHLELDRLKPGQWRNLTDAELKKLHQSVKSSTKTSIKNVGGTNTQQGNRHKS